MNYIFDDSILYQPDDGTLHVLESGAEDIVTLTPVLNRILLLLVSRQGQLITKDEFLAKVWDDYGKTGSSHTLNQYLSTLRGIFLKHLNKKTIITVPRQGYMFSLEIAIATVDPTAEQSIVPVPNEAPSQPSGEPVAKMVEDATRQTKKYLAVYAVILLAAIAMTRWLTPHFRTPIKQNYSQLGTIGQCPVYDLLSSKKDQQRSNEIMVKVNDMANMFNLNCSDNVHFYYYHNTNQIKGKEGIYSMLTRCEKTDKIRTCLTTRVSW
ncbi:winged helix-turn-helix domain-containing protein [Serratia fonticola]|uniref:winged helix-turn-helix domain-containing protein n=1 Tax=Serratia fonticola TaxID=47917 RepID=UPI0015C5BE94|nr:winged helix-turn-helix domain-containing protein [Serratia fonticola]MBC3382200.1 winged helix-turn-helix domain-containing protein [Serratia fonticola]NYA41399.1 winged helix-turn-helix domain-containing protein [Serratia fonticola]